LKSSLNRYYTKVYDSTTTDQLLGIEGAVSSYMFKKFKERLNNNGIQDFKKREYRPSHDKINMLLNFSYTIYSNLLYGILLNDGFDPYIGLYHKKRGSHHAFVSDIIEPQRASITWFILKLFINKILVESDFDGIHLTKDGRVKFLLEYSKFIDELTSQSKEFIDVLGDRLV
jgi:CRISPR-associated protein Cas1